MSNSHTVVITQVRLTHYRIAFFKMLRNELASRDVQLVLLYGQPAHDEMKKNDVGFIDWAVNVRNKYWQIRNTNIVWQPFPVKFRSADLVVITQENRIVSNYFHLLKRIFFGTKVAFWGHGANLQSSNPNGLKERFKRLTTRQVDWWFAYTQMSADLVQASGFSVDRITVLNNSVDTSEMQSHRNSISQHEIEQLKKSQGFEVGPVGVFVGSLYPNKRLDFLFEAAEAIRLQVPDFHLLIVGDGNQRDMVRAWCVDRPWVRWVGSSFGRKKAAYLSVANVMLNPGLVGLGILDSFVFELPMLTTACGIHSPEISYLENGVNGVMTVDNLDEYVNACVDLLNKPEKLETLRAGCRSSVNEFTLENMAHRFADGVMSCLNESSYKGSKV
jgi:glycosyltransferase involved in cell wall biosynthesis